MCWSMDVVLLGKHPVLSPIIDLHPTQIWLNLCCSPVYNNSRSSRRPSNCAYTRDRRYVNPDGQRTESRFALASMLGNTDRRREAAVGGCVTDSIRLTKLNEA